MDNPTDSSNPFAVLSKSGGRSFDIYSRLLGSRMVFISTAIDDYVANGVIGDLLYLQHENPSEEIRLFINSPGGTVLAGMMIYETMQMVSCDVSITCIGKVAGMATVILAGGAHGKRTVLPNGQVRLSPVSVAYHADDQIEWDGLDAVTPKLAQILTRHTGQNFEKVMQDIAAGSSFTAEEALAYGIVDTVIRPEAKAINRPDPSLP